MTGIVLSAAVRQNLLSLQSTSQLLATTQNDLATGNKVNSALDNPTNYFTASALNGRASDISNLLDSVGNGVQVLQAANTGITSLKSLLDSAKSIANQALQATSGYSQKSQFSATIAGADANNLMGNADTAATVTGSAVTSLAAASALNTAAGGGFANGDSFTINGTTFNFVTGGTGAGAATVANGNTVTVNLTYGSGSTATTTDDLTAAIKTALGGGTADAAISGNKLTLTSSDPSENIVLAGTALSKLGLTAGTTAGINSAMEGKTLTIGSTANGTATSITFGSDKSAGQISTLNDLNSALAANNLMATVDTNGKLTISTTNNNASATVGGTVGVGGTAAATGGAFVSAAGVQTAAVADASSQQTRAGLVSQFNTILDQLKTTAQDSSFNGVNLLNGDLLQLTFNETGTSTLNIQGNIDDPAGLGLSSLTAGTDFLDNAGTNKIIAAITNASNTLDSQASNLGSNLSIVQIRQKFSTSMINVLQTGASNLTLADPNELAADSQALSTRQSIAVSALALANQSQQSVLQLLQG